MENIYYVYVYVDPRKDQTKFGSYVFDGEPFYVGKGKNKRAWTHLTESKNRTHNTLKFNKIQRILSDNATPSIMFIGENMDEQTALQLEENIIKTIGTKWNIAGIETGPLCNMTSGGEGRTPSEELRKRFANYGSDNGMWGKTHSPETRTKISNFRKTFRHSLETRELMKTLRSNGNNHNTKKWIVVCPDGTEEIVGYLKEYCSKNQINYHSLYNTLTYKKPITRGKSKGYMLKEYSD